MASNFKFKLLSHLTQKKEEKGFTLIELLVVVIIIGVLAAIALPNLLGQVGKARNSEARNGVGAINRAQQVYRTEHRGFAALADLDTTVPNSTVFTFTSANSGATGSASTLASPVDSANDNTEAQSGTVTYDAGDFTVTTSW